MSAQGTVVNCKCAHIRPTYDNLKEWVADSNNVYIGRAGVVFVDGARFPQRASPFCNPYKIGVDGTRDEVIKKYRDYINERLKAEPAFKKQLAALKGKTLGCWCKPEPCHGEVLIELLASL